jgi:hypothetical protein
VASDGDLLLVGTMPGETYTAWATRMSPDLKQTHWTYMPAHEDWENSQFTAIAKGPAGELRLVGSAGIVGGDPADAVVIAMTE